MFLMFSKFYVYTILYPSMHFMMLIANELKNRKKMNYVLNVLFFIDRELENRKNEIIVVNLFCYVWIMN